VIEERDEHKEVYSREGTDAYGHDEELGCKNEAAELINKRESARF
jgi:hypothetical protein